MPVRGRIAAAAMAGVATLVACGDDRAVTPAEPRPIPGFELSSPAFAEGDPIPREHSCEGPSPELVWAGVPEGTAELALTLLDPDGYFGPCPPAGDRHRYVFTLYALGSTLELERGASPSEAVAAVQEGDVTATTELTGTFAR